MSKVLYMIRKPVEALEEGILPDFTDTEHQSNASILLLEDGVTSQHLPNVPVYALRDDVMQRGMTTSVPLISYQEIVKLVFEVDRVIVL